jgi:hypothetical protein
MPGRDEAGQRFRRGDGTGATPRFRRLLSVENGKVIALSRRVATYALKQPVKDRDLGSRLMAASQEFSRFGYRRSAIWLNESERRVKRLWRQLGLNLPRRRPRRRRCGTDMRLLGAVRPNHVWTYDFVHDRLAGKRTIRMLCVLDEHTRECLGNQYPVIPCAVRRIPLACDTMDGLRNLGFLLSNVSRLYSLNFERHAGNLEPARRTPKIVSPQMSAYASAALNRGSIC